MSSSFQASCAYLAYAHATAGPKKQKFPLLHVIPSAGHRIRSTECNIEAGFELLICKVLMSVMGSKAGVAPLVSCPTYTQQQTSSGRLAMSDPICFSFYLYRSRNLIERFFNKI
jgi:hypothetical protein